MITNVLMLKVLYLIWSAIQMNDTELEDSAVLEMLPALIPQDHTLILCLLFNTTYSIRYSLYLGRY